MIRIKSRERGIYVERFDNGFWRLLTITDTQQEALNYIQAHYRGEIHVQLQTKREDVKG